MQSDFFSSERRQHQRSPCHPPFPAMVERNNERLRAWIDDISPAGAKVRLPNANNNTPLQVQGSFEYTIETPYGPFHCKATTSWVQRVGDDFTWGIEFNAINHRDDDPIRVFIKQLTGQAM